MSTQYNYTRTNSPGYLQGAIDMIESALLAQGAWTLVDTVNSPGGMPARVWRMSGTVCPRGIDWYLVIARTTANPQTFYFAIAEGYNPDTKKLTRPGPGSNNGSTIPASDYSYGGGTEYAMWTGTTGSSLNTADIYWYTVNTAATWIDCYVVANNAGLFFWCFQGSNYPSSVYAGWGEPLDSSMNTTLILSDFLNTGLGSVTTRHPTVVSAQASNWRFANASDNYAQWTPAVGTMNGSGDRFWNGRPIGGRRCIRTNQGAAQYGDLLGLYPSILCINQTGVSAGDRTSIPRPNDPAVSDTYVYAYRYNTGNSIWINTTADI